jgi:hypothetical protein
MMARWKAIAAALATAGAVTLAAVTVLFNPIARTDTAGAPLVHPLVGFLVYVLTTVALFDWAASQMRSAFKAAFAIAASQFLLVNVDFVLSGKRGVMTAMASTIVLVLTWGSVATVYSRLLARQPR